MHQVFECVTRAHFTLGTNRSEASIVSSRVVHHFAVCILITVGHVIRRLGIADAADSVRVAAVLVLTLLYNVDEDTVKEQNQRPSPGISTLVTTSCRYHNNNKDQNYI